MSMNKRIKYILFLSLLLSLSVSILTPPLAWASSTIKASSSNNDDYEEVSYDDLLLKLSSKTKKNHANSSSSFDDIKIHAGIGYINSFADIKTSAGTLRRHQNGLQLAVGMELFSTNWYSESSFKNFGITTGVSDEVSLKEVEIKIGYKNQVQRPWSFLVNTGISNRFLNYTNFSTQERISATTPSMLIGMGLSAGITEQLSLSFEMNGKSPIVNETTDRGSFDFSLRMNAIL